MLGWGLITVGEVFMKGYLDLVSHVLEHGERREDRTGVGTLSIFTPRLPRASLRTRPEKAIS